MGVYLFSCWLVVYSGLEKAQGNEEEVDEAMWQCRLEVKKTFDECVCWIHCSPLEFCIIGSSQCGDALPSAV